MLIKHKEDDDTFSQRVLTLVSGSCLQSMSCSIQPSNSLSWVFSEGSSVEGIFNRMKCRRCETSFAAGAKFRLKNWRNEFEFLKKKKIKFDAVQLRSAWIEEEEVVDSPKFKNLKWNVWLDLSLFQMSNDRSVHSDLDSGESDDSVFGNKM